MKHRNHAHGFRAGFLLLSLLISGMSLSLAEPVRAGGADPRLVLPTIRGTTLVKTEVRPQVSLRGFGKLSAQGAVWDGPSGRISLVRFLADSPESAKIIGAKYLTDFQSYGAFSPLAGEGFGEATVMSLSDGGVWVVGVNGTEVGVLSGASLDALRPVAKALKAERWCSPSLNTFPAYLGSFDRFSLGQWWMPNTKNATITEFFRDHPAAINAHADDFSASYAPHVYDTSGAANILAQSREMGKPYRLMFWGGIPAWWGSGNEKEVEQPAQRTLMRSLLDAGAHSAINITQMASDAANAVQLDALSQFMGRYVDDPNVLGWLQPHGEFHLQVAPSVHPDGRARFMRFLRDEKGYSLAQVNELHDRANQSWTDVELPDASYFCGRRGRFIDLDEATWRWQPGADLAGGQAKKWHEPDFDDQAWAEDFRWSKRLLSQQAERGSTVGTHPVWFRFSGEIPAGFPETGKRVYLHVMPLSEREGRKVSVWVNGSEAVELSRDGGNTMLHVQFDVTDLVRTGANQFAIYNAGGSVRSRVFLSETAGASFPFPDARLNRLWVDWREYLVWEKLQTLDLYLRWMRTVDPVRPIKVMTPYLFQSRAMDLFTKYGAYPQLTGQMAGYYRPMHYKGYARLRGLPGSSEPGSPVRDARNAQGMFSNMFWESQDAHDYVFDPARDMWPYPEVVQWWSDNKPLLKTLGKIDFAPAQAGVLRDLEQEILYSNSKIWNWDLARGPLPSAGITPVLVDGRDFDEKLADHVPVIFDCATLVMTPERVRSVMRYIEEGGVFIAQHHTGQHTPEQRNTWPLAAAFGLEVKEHLTNDGSPHTWPIAPIRFTQTQSLLPSLRGKKVDGCGVSIDWQGRSDGGAISLKGEMEDVTPIATWADGSMAVCEVRRGKGRIIWLGSPFLTRMMDENGRWMNEDARQALLTELLAGLGIQRGATSSDPRVWVEKRESKNGLYDVYLAAAMNIRGNDWKLTDEITATLSVGGACPGGSADATPVVFDPTLAGSPLISVERAESGFQLKDQTWHPFQVRQFAVVRADAGLAGPLHWLDVQSKTWRATADPAVGSLADLGKAAKAQIVLNHEDGLDLSADWKVRVLTSAPAASDKAWTQPVFDDQAWQSGGMGTWLATGWKDAASVQYRKTVALPEGWLAPGKRVLLGFNGFHLLGMRDQGLLWLNGATSPLSLPRNAFLTDITAAARSGELSFALQVSGASLDKGAGGVFYLRSVDAPAGALDLSGEWETRTDWHLIGSPITLPGSIKGTFGLRKTFVLPEGWSGKRVRLVIDASDTYGVHGVFVNDDGYVRTDRKDLFPLGIRIDTWLKPGTNHIELYGFDHHHGPTAYKKMTGQLNSLRLEVFD